MIFTDIINKKREFRLMVLEIVGGKLLVDINGELCYISVKEYEEYEEEYFRI